MTDAEDFPVADHVFDGGTMDCGSGLILLIRQNMLKVPIEGILEIRSNEPTVESELPPWCRMVGHSHIRSELVEAGFWRHWVQRGKDSKAEEAALDSDKQEALAFKWSIRARRTKPLETSVYSRNFSWNSGGSVDFDRSAEIPSSLEQFLGSILSDVINNFAIRCSRSQIPLDELEGTLNAALNNSLAAVGIEEGDSSLREIRLVVFVTTPTPELEVRECWDSALRDSPVYQTLKKSCEMESKIVFL